MRPAVAHILENHVNTVPELVLTAMYERREKAEHVKTAMYGSPEREVRKKIFGALPAAARPSVQRLRFQVGRTESTRKDVCLHRPLEAM